VTRLSAFSGRSILISLENAIGVIGRDGFSLSQQFKIIEEGLWQQLLGKESIDDHGGSYADAVEVLTHAEGDEHEGAASDLHDDDLQHEDTHHDEDEQVVVENVFEDVHLLLLQFSCVEEVEHLQEDEHVEEDTQVLTVCVVPLLDCETDRACHSENLVPLEENYHQDNYLVN